MSLIRSLMADDHEDDPIFGSYMQSMRHMNDMMNSMFSDPFSMLGYPSHNAITDGSHRTGVRHPNNHQLMPFGFPPMPMFNMGNVLADFDQMAAGGNCQTFTSKSVMTRGPDGRPQVYQETMSTTSAPGGVKETKKTVCDSRTGLKKMAIGHHIGERAHILEREHNLRNGAQEEHQEFINLEEDEAESFNNEWETLTRHGHGTSHRTRPAHRQLALPDASASSNSSGRNQSTKSPPATAAAAAVIGNRKRKHVPDDKDSKKCHVVSDSNV
ncbi:myeloid leukemia factor 2 isoform X2 [Ceratina calcarata]|uniref:Myeloid leukemia factor 2 isoform X2 n=1 Tax=Ceratina calcarata TaxID=156304 RepID=A0AAJ7IX11_9HYME|nr:myeloid leukemia factor 2 isoform X2 [Ceratina calcarata]